MPNIVKQLIDLTKSGTSEGAIAGWEARRGGAGSKEELHGKISAKETGTLAEGISNKDRKSFEEHLKSQGM